MTHYDTLGLQPDADPAAIKKAFRKAAQMNHPDKGGSTEGMQAIQKAYDTLSDPERRTQYDETGDDTPPNNLRDQAMAQLQGLLLQCLDQVDETTTPILEKMAKALINEVNKGAKIIEQDKVLIAKRERALDRLTKKQGSNLLAMVLEFDIKRLEDHIKHTEGVMAGFGMMQTILAEYEYRADSAPQWTTTSTSTGFEGMFGGRYR